MTKIIPSGPLSTPLYGAIEAYQEERRRPARAAHTGFVGHSAAMILLVRLLTRIKTLPLPLRKLSMTDRLSRRTR